MEILLHTLSELVYPTPKVINLHFIPNYIKRKENICFSLHSVRWFIVRFLKDCMLLKGTSYLKSEECLAGCFGLFVELSSKCFSKWIMGAMN